LRVRVRACACVELALFISCTLRGHGKRGLYLLTVSGRWETETPDDDTFLVCRESI
jgi:hypothetical protein